MSGPRRIRRILFVAPKRDVQPILGELRSTGHEVSQVEDLGEARAIVGMIGFDAAVLPIEKFNLLMERGAIREDETTDLWRRTVAGVLHDVGSLISALNHTIRDVRLSQRDRDLDTLSRSVEGFSQFLGDLTGELVAACPGEVSTGVDLEDAIEAAAMIVYPSALARGQQFVTNVSPSVSQITTNSTSLKRAVRGVLEYASCFASDDSEVRVDANGDRGECVIAVSFVRRADPWSGGGPLNHAWRGEQTLPLALAQQHMESVGGRLWIERENDSGVVYIAVPQPRRRGRNG